ncbi:CCA tRNA nucleotidyltransferase [Terriglobus tenax]|uniref:CCA tRNA nucleotidyltransferase n=1 Tax=Terriglobus tenax TaxID=1111115 RepID=UPI00295AFE4E|nr:CCA tRNA nucleotidyltransferase [Terriglobus tenax]
MGEITTTIHYHETHMQSPQFQAALTIAQTLQAAGHQAYFAGGCVRDLLLGLTPKDYDVATSATPQQVQALFPNTVAVGAHFGVILVLQPGPDYPGPEAADIPTEVATFRNDGSYTDGRRPDQVTFSTSPEEDVRRRDFTINGMLLDPAKLAAGASVEEATLDLVHGRDDLRTGILRAIGDPRLRFTEDKLRMLRAVRFAARLGYIIETTTLAAIRELAPQIHQVSPERVRDELTRMLTQGNAHIALRLLDETGLLTEVLPEVRKMQGIEQPPQYHPEGDVWVHTLLLLEKLPPSPSATLAWGALLHDIGKPATFRRAPDRIRFDGHVEVGERIAEVILNRLRFSNDDKAQILALIHNHMRFGDVMHMRQSTLKRFLRMPRFEEHLHLHYLDAGSASGNLTLYEFAKQKYETMPEDAVKPTLLVNGRTLIEAGYKPGPRFTEMLHFVEDAQLEGQVATTEEGLKLLLQHFGPPA